MGRFQELLRSIIGDTPGGEVAATIGKSRSYVSQIRDKVVPSDTIIALIAEKYAPDRLGDLLHAAASDRLAAQDFEEALENLEPDPIKRKERANRLRKLTEGALAASRGVESTPSPPAMGTGRTFRDFPEAFYPLAVVTGDKREERGFLISIADFGAYSASPADTRWIFNLGLDHRVMKHIDKNFVLLPDDDLAKGFAERNLLVIGSPASNHLARMVNGSAIFRFNYKREAENAITSQIEKAKGMSKAQLSAYHDYLREQLSTSKRSLFAGGFMDPTYPPSYVAATYSKILANVQFDFGVLTFCANPFYERLCRSQGRENDHKYISILAAGIHHPATAHAVRLLGKDAKAEGVFDQHPFGGIIRVELDLEEKFSLRAEKATCEWEDVVDGSRKPLDDQKGVILEQLERIEKKIREEKMTDLELSADQAAAARELVIRLSRQQWAWQPALGATSIR